MNRQCLSVLYSHPLLPGTDHGPPFFHRRFYLLVFTEAVCPLSSFFLYCLTFAGCFFSPRWAEDVGESQAGVFFLFFVFVSGTEFPALFSFFRTALFPVRTTFINCPSALHFSLSRRIVRRGGVFGLRIMLFFFFAASSTPPPSIVFTSTLLQPLSNLQDEILD